MFALLLNRADPNLASDDGHSISPLQQALLHGNVRMADVLIDHPRIHLDRRNTKKATALQFAVCYRRVAQALKMVAKGANPSLLDANGDDALHYCVDPRFRKDGIELLKVLDAILRKHNRALLPHSIPHATDMLEEVMRYKFNRRTRQQFRSAAEAKDEPTRSQLLEWIGHRYNSILTNRFRLWCGCMLTVI